MYDLPRPGKARDRSDDGSSPKCIRPLASELLLQPGHDEIRAHGSQINGSCRGARFFARAYDAPINCFVITSRTSLSAPKAALRRRPDPCVHRARPAS